MASYSGNILLRHETREDLPRVSAAKVEKYVALFGDAYLFDKAAHTNALPDMILRLFWQNGGCLAVSGGQQDNREE